MPRVHRPDTTRRQALLWLVQHGVQGILLARTGRHKGNARGVVQDGVRERDAFLGMLRAVLDVRYPAVLLAEELVAGEERAGVAVGADAEEDEVEDGKARGVLHGELVDELLLVRVRELLEVVREVRVDRVDLVRGDARGKLGEELAHAERVVRVFVVERDDALVGIEDVPVVDGQCRLCLSFRPLDRRVYPDEENRMEVHVPLVPLDGGVVHEPAELLGERASGEGDGEAALLLDRLFLCFDDKLRERADELGRGGEGQQNRCAWGGVWHRDGWVLVCTRGGGKRFEGKGGRIELDARGRYLVCSIPYACSLSVLYNQH